MASAAAKMDVDASPKAVKRKASKGGDSSDEEGGDDVEMLDVSFDFFDPQPHDYHSIKLLLSQLLSHDAKDLDMGSVADLVLQQKLVGSTVKTDGAEGDPYALLTILNLNVHKDTPCMASLIKYLLAKLPAGSEFHTLLASLLSAPAASPEDSTAASPKHVGLVLSERLVNMPAQVVPPMYRMLQEELSWARDDKEPYHFSHLLFLSRVFLASSSDFEEDPNAALNPAALGAGGKKGGKKTKKSHITKEEKEKEETWVYHPEDDFIAKSALHNHTFAYSNSPSQQEKEKDSFGVETRGQMMLVEYSKFDSVVTGMESFLGGME